MIWLSELATGRHTVAIPMDDFERNSYRPVAVVAIVAIPFLIKEYI